MEVQKLQEAHKARENDLIPGNSVGFPVLARQREYEKPGKDQDPSSIEAGEFAAHFGSSVADAIRLGPAAEKEDQEWYKKKYGSTIKLYLEVICWSPAWLTLLDGAAQ